MAETLFFLKHILATIEAASIIIITAGNKNICAAADTINGVCNAHGDIPANIGEKSIFINVKLINKEEKIGGHGILNENTSANKM